MKRIVALAMAAFLGMAAVGCSSGPKGEEVVATVNGKEITVKEYETNLALFKQSIESLYGTSIWDTEIEKGVKYKDKFKELMVDQIADIEIIYDQAKKDNLLPTEEEVNTKFKELKANIDADENYKKSLENIGVTDEFLKKQQEQDLALNNFKENFDKTTTVSDEEIQNYYDKDKENFYQVKASHILISTLDENGKELSDDKKKEAKAKAEEVLKKIEAGEEFAALAKEYSADTGSAAEGGDLGYFKKGVMVAEFEDAAFGLEAGEVSDIVETQFGYHIIKVFDKLDENKLTVEDVEDEIKTILLNEKYAQTMEKLRKEAKIEKNEDVIKKVKF